MLFARSYTAGVCVWGGGGGEVGNGGNRLGRKLVGKLIKNDLSQ